MKHLLLLAALLLGVAPISAIATDYYYCDCKDGASSQCAAGKDSNLGISLLLPRKTLSNASSTFNDFSA